jgi:HD-like signal output (HDOD) protein
VTPFFREFSDLTSFESRLADYPEARLYLLRVIGRSLAASVYAADWAVYRHDLDAAVIQEAALLHDLAEMLTWCFAPTLSIRMQQRRTAAPTMRSVEIQQSVLGISLEDLSVELLREWRLPSLLLRLANHHESGNSAVQNVVLAANLARHAAHGWQDPALRDDYEQIGKLLNQSPEWVQRRVESGDDAAETLAAAAD